MADHDSFAELMNRLRLRDQDAATAVFHRFAGRLIRLAGARLNPRTQQKVDPEDVVQSAFRSFFLRHDAGRLDVSNWDELWSLLTIITVRKCANQAAHFRAKRRDVADEVVLAGESDAMAIVDGAINREPTPSQAAMLAETVEQILRELKPADRVIIELSLQGYSVVEISARLGLAERTVRRLREHVKHRLLRMHSDGP